MNLCAPIKSSEVSGRCGASNNRYVGEQMQRNERFVGPKIRHGTRCAGNGYHDTRRAKRAPDLIVFLLRRDVRPSRVRSHQREPRDEHGCGPPSPIIADLFLPIYCLRGRHLTTSPRAKTLVTIYQRSKTSRNVPFGADEGRDEEGQPEQPVHPVLEGGLVGPGGRPRGVRDAVG